jgi:hypothetical protein
MAREAAPLLDLRGMGQVFGRVFAARRRKSDAGGNGFPSRLSLLSFL